jgi:hypothetical protein
MTLSMIPSNPALRMMAKQIPMVFNPEDLMGRSFMMDTDNDGHVSQAQIVKLIG